MIFLIFMTAAIVVYGMGVVPCLGEKRTASAMRIISVFGGAMLLKIFLAAVSVGYESDFHCFTAWADMVYGGGFSNFYKTDAFTDYPPGYMYILWVLGFLKQGLSENEYLLRILFKLPSLLCELFSACLLLRMGKKNRSALFLAACFLLNPAVILNSSLWGQVDSVLMFFVFLAVVLLVRGKATAYLVFAFAVLLKPQALILTPVMLFGYYDWAYQKKQWRRHTLFGFGALGLLVVLSLPFGVEEVFLQYQSTMASYPYFSVNAFNLWAALGQNWAELTPMGNAAGILLIAFVTVFSFYLLYRGKGSSRFFFVGGFLYFAAYLFSVKMHDRYAYPAIVFFAAAYLLSGKRRHYRVYAAVGASQVFNMAYTLYFYQKNPNLYYQHPVISVASILNLLLFVYLILTAFYPSVYQKKRTVQKSERPTSFCGKDFFAVSLVTILYAAVAFFGLGDRAMPERGVRIDSEEIKIFLVQPQEISEVMICFGELPSEPEAFRAVLYGVNGEKAEYLLEEASVFRWYELPISEKFAVKSIGIASRTDAVPIREVGVFSGETCLEISAEKTELCDEQDLVPRQSTYRNSTYFDEIYHARTAYELLHRLPIYEWTHPPLGKILIAGGIRVFGMNPFGWRFAGTLFGVLMVPVFYAFAKLILKKTWRCTLCTLWFAFDFMHYTQTRIATIDCFVTFFILLMFCLMYRYCMQNFYDTTLRKTLRPLFFCGISCGLAIACKWQGVYAAVGLACCFFLTMYRRYAEARSFLLLPFRKNFYRTCGACCLFFVLIPMVIYALSYLPYLAANGEGFDGMIQNQIDMYTYHSKTVVESTHAYASKWYSWPLMLRPIWYYSASFSDGTKAGISAFGNPAVWWVGIAASGFCAYRAVWKRDLSAGFLLIAYAAQYVPWIAVERTTFIYHYFPSVPFVVLMTGLAAERLKLGKRKLILYTAAVLVLFLMFYPVLSGMPIDPSYVRQFLKWLPGWVLI